MNPVNKAGKLQDAGYAALGFGIVLVLWIVLGLVYGDTRFPSPWGIAEKFVTQAFSSPEIALQGAGTGGFIPHVLATLLRYLIGIVSGVLLSFICLFLIARFRTFKELFIPVIDILRAIPPLALAPFMLLWFGTTPAGIVAVAIFYAFTMIFVAGTEAIDRLDPAQNNFGLTLGAGKTAIVSSVIMPSILPAMAGPIKVAASWSWGLVIIGELLGARSGIGRILNAFIPLLSTDLIIIATIWILLLAVVMERLINYLFNRLLRWMPGTRV